MRIEAHVACPVTVEDKGALRLIGLSRPDVHNALNEALIVGLRDALRDAPPYTRVVVLFGHGSSFSAGGDRREGIGGSHGHGLESLHLLQEIARLLSSPRLVAIAAVEGWAIGGGAELALACDLIVASDTATFRFPEIELGTNATGGSTWLLPRMVGIARANLLFLTARPLPASEAFEWGLVSEMVKEGYALARAREFAETIARYSKDATESIKRSVRLAVEGSLEDALTSEVGEAHPRLGPGGFLGPSE